MSTLQYDQIKDELLETFPIAPGELYPLYSDEMANKEKITVAYQALKRSIRSKDRKMALISAYFIGRILAETKNTTEEYRLKSLLTRHYVALAEKTYLLFKANPPQIF